MSARCTRKQELTYRYIKPVFPEPLGPQSSVTLPRSKPVLSTSVLHNRASKEAMPERTQITASFSSACSACVADTVGSRSSVMVRTKSRCALISSTYAIHTPGLIWDAATRCRSPYLPYLRMVVIRVASMSVGTVPFGRCHKGCRRSATRILLSWRISQRKHLPRGVRARNKPVLSLRH